MRKSVEILFYSFPLSFIIGNLAVNLYSLLFIVASLFLINKEQLAFRFKNSYWILIIFFLYFFLSTTIQYQDIESLKILLYQDQGPEFFNEKIKDTLLKNNSIFKSLMLVRFLILIFVVDTLFFNKILNLKKFFLFSLCCTSFVSLDVILQYITGSDLFGYKSFGTRNSGPFGDEVIAGAYLQRFSFFSFFSIFAISDKKNLNNPLLISLIIIHAAAMLLAGNKMSMLLFLFGCGLTIMFIKKSRIAMTVGISGFLVIFFLIIKNDSNFKDAYYNFYGNIKHFVGTRYEIRLPNTAQQDTEKIKFMEREKDVPSILRGSGHYYIYHNSILVWQDQPLFGFGLKSFRIKCWENLTDDTMKLRTKNKNQLYLACSTHPHNYYLELLSESGIVGASLLFIFFIILWKDFFHYFIKHNRQTDPEAILLVPIVISIFLQIWPLQSTGSFFSTWNATFFWLTVALLLANNKKRLV